ncbi:hypothetical protein EJ06DRAFT_555363 [Trichodelitschia bisporula]|uniref:Uncharacterized protein n=1 Tax=Trichodelitschia bisporula TaxID=703511 RepID=A0A6G1I0Q8_9PEZI|nr:hypothetical protein EJ06DRAFT_555363 [Trichodelitschia bisporula]
MVHGGRTGWVHGTLSVTSLGMLSCFVPPRQGVRPGLRQMAKSRLQVEGFISDRSKSQASERLGLVFGATTIAGGKADDKASSDASVNVVTSTENIDKEATGHDD